MNELKFLAAKARGEGDRFLRAELRRAVYHENEREVAKLLRRGAYTQPTQHPDPIFIAIDTGNMVIFEMLVKEKPTSLHARDYSTGFPIHRAAEKGNIDLVKRLLELGLSINASDIHGYTPLDRLLRRGDERIFGKFVSELREMGAVTKGTLRG